MSKFWMGVAIAALNFVMAGEALGQAWGSGGIVMGAPRQHGDVGVQAHGSGNFGVGGIRQQNSVLEGTVVHVAPASLHVPADTGTRVVGATVPGVLCAAASRKAGWQVSAALGVACGAIGEQVARRAGAEEREAVELVVRLSSGALLSVAQQGYTSDFARGDKVFVMRGGGVDRVVRAN